MRSVDAGARANALSMGAKMVMPVWLAWLWNFSPTLVALMSCRKLRNCPALCITWVMLQNAGAGAGAGAGARVGDGVGGVA